MNILIFKQIEHEIRDLTFEVAEIEDEIVVADADTDIDALHERRKQLEQRRAHLRTQILHLIVQR
jgi:hypothetical protein